jgi:hypothetical protein
VNLRLRSLLASLGAGTMLVGAGSLTLLVFSASYAWDRWPSESSHSVPAIELSPAPPRSPDATPASVSERRTIALASPRAVAREARERQARRQGAAGDRAASRTRGNGRRDSGSVPRSPVPAPTGRPSPPSAAPSPSPSPSGPSAPNAPRPRPARPSPPVATPALPAAPVPAPVTDVVRGVAPGVVEQVDRVGAAVGEVVAPVLDAVPVKVPPLGGLGGR